MDVKIKLIIVFIIFSCVLCAQEEIDISKLAKEHAAKLETQGWKVHSGSASIYEQLYSAYVYEIYNDIHNPLQRLYKGIASDKFRCVISMLEKYAQLDIQDWFYEYERSFIKNNAGLENLIMAGEITYPECVCELNYTYDSKCESSANPYFEIRVSNISDNFRGNYQSVIIPFVSLYRRNQDGSREEMLIAAFTDEFLENRRVKIPIFDNFGDCREQNVIELHLNDTEKDSHRLLESFSIHPKKILNYQTQSIENYQTRDGIYEERKAFQGMLLEERIRIIAEVQYILNE